MIKKSLNGRLFSLTSAVILASLSLVAVATEYKIDPAHSFVQFRIQHLGYSWLYGRFNTISGNFTYDPETPQASAIFVEIDADSVDTNHAERDKHLRGEDFLNVEKFPKATFKSTKYNGTADGGVLEGELTLHGVTKPVKLDVKKLGEGKDPWGGYRAGFIATTTLTRNDFGISYNLGPASETMELELGIEGIKE
jgi:polyisoprenoid-binding protein YceI